MLQQPPSIVAVPSTEAVVAAPGCHVQITKTDDGGYSFNADIFVAGTKVSSVYCEGMEVYYEDLDRRWELGWRVAGMERCPADLDRYAPLYNAIADLKVLCDAGVSILAGHLRRIGLANMIAVKPGRYSMVVPTKVRGSIAPCAIDVAIWEADPKNNGAYIIDTDNSASLAATLINESQFKSSFMDGFRPLQDGEAITGLYYRMVLAADRVEKLQADFSNLAQYRASDSSNNPAHTHRGQELGA